MKPILFLSFLMLSFAGAAEERLLAELEDEFSAMLKNATLKGSWVPVEAAGTGTEKGDSYRVVRATKIEADRWEIVSRMKFQGREIDFPIPVIIKWAGDTAVMILDEIPTAGGKKYSARVMFHDDRYAGSWWGKDQPGGLLSGVITRDSP